MNSIVLRRWHFEQGACAWSSHALQNGDCTRAWNAVRKGTDTAKNIKEEEKEVEERSRNETQQAGEELLVLARGFLTENVNVKHARN